MTLYSHKVAREPADWEHPFGHGKFESLGTVTVGGILLTTGLGVGYNSLLSIQEMLWQTTTSAPFSFDGQGLASTFASPETAMAVALSSVILKEAMYHFTLKAGENANSKVVIANAHHHRSDALSSLVALAGIAGGVFFEMPWLDPVAGLLVAGMVMRTGADITTDSMKVSVTADVGVIFNPFCTNKLITFVYRICINIYRTLLIPMYLLNTLPKLPTPVLLFLE